ncbi:MAG: hypothetical protein ACREQI_13005 [Candidatus Binataceae bacterium]
MPAKSNFWTYLLVGAACLLLGFAGSTIAYRMRWLEVPGSPFMARLNRELQLNSEQRAKIADILRDTRAKMTDLHHQFWQGRHKLFWKGFDRIRAVLTPEQQKIFDREFKPPPPDPPLPPGSHPSPAPPPPHPAR